MKSFIIILLLCVIGGSKLFAQKTEFIDVRTFRCGSRGAIPSFLRVEQQGGELTGSHDKRV